jgi:CRISPR-associated protein Cas6
MSPVTDIEPAFEALDLSFPLAGAVLPAGYALAMGRTLLDWLPWLEAGPGGLHPLKAAHGPDGEALLSHRARLLLRVPAARQAEATRLAGRVLPPGCGSARLGAPQVRALTAHSTLYAHVVATPDDDEVRFLAATATWLDGLRVRAEPVCGRLQRWSGPQGPAQGYSLMLHGLSPADSLRVQVRGMGPWRWLGCGLFVPHKSAAAVGS